MLDLNRLRVLTEVADRGSFSAAADALFLTQPAVSRQIAALERDLGTPLVERLPRGVRLTQAGELACAHARTILAQLTAAEDQIRGLGRLDGGRLRMAGFASANAALVPEVITRFRKRHPSVELSLVAGHDPAKTLVAVRDGELDLALISAWDADRPEGRTGLDVLPLLNDQVYVAVGPEHPLASRRRIRLADLVEETWIDGAHPDCCGPFDGFREIAGFQPRVGFQCDDWNGKQALVAAGAGIMLFPGLAVPTARPDVVLRPVSPALPPRPVMVVTRADHRAATVAPMLELLREAAPAYEAPVAATTSTAS